MLPIRAGAEARLWLSRRAATIPVNNTLQRQHNSQPFNSVSKKEREYTHLLYRQSGYATEMHPPSLLSPQLKPRRLCYSTTRFTWDKRASYFVLRSVTIDNFMHYILLHGHQLKSWCRFAVGRIRRIV